MFPKFLSLHFQIKFRDSGCNVTDDRYLCYTFDNSKINESESETARKYDKKKYELTDKDGTKLDCGNCNTPSGLF